MVSFGFIRTCNYWLYRDKALVRICWLVINSYKSFSTTSELDSGFGLIVRSFAEKDYRTRSRRLVERGRY
jgi:hypothetical protein